MIKLVSTFLNSEGKTHNFTVKDPDTTKSPEEIKESLKLLSSLHLFEKDGVVLFQEVVKAKFVETIEHPIFEGDELFGVPAPEEKPEEVEQPQQPTALRCTWQEAPKVPEAPSDLPAIRSEVHEVLSASMNNQAPAEPAKVTVEKFETTKSLANKEEAAPSSDNFYDVVKEMVKRKKRRKAKEEERRNRKSPPDSPS